MGAEQAVAKMNQSTDVLDLTGVRITEIPEKLPPKKWKEVRLTHVGLSNPNLPKGHPTVKQLWLDGNDIRTITKNLAEAIASYPKLQVLDLGSNNIEEISEDIKLMKNIHKISFFDNKLTLYNLDMPKLTSINLGQNDLHEIPQVFRPHIISLQMDFNFIEAFENCVMPNIQKLSLGMVGLQRIDKAMVFSKLQYLNVERNRLTELPDFNVFAPELQVLSAGDNFLTEFPSVNKTKITEISVRRNKITELPCDLLDYENLAVIDFSENDIDFVPLVPTKIKQIIGTGNRIVAVSASVTPELRRFLLSGNQFETLPQLLDNKMVDYVMNDNIITKIDLEFMSSEITNIELMNNRIELLPRELFFRSKIKRLVLVRNCIKEVPLEIVRCEQMEYLNLSENPIETLPPLPIGLKHLCLSKCNFKELPDHLGTLRSLETLCVTGNEITTFPSFNSAKIMILSQNKISKWPKSLPSTVEILDLSMNELTSVPSSFELPRLLDLDLSYNKLTKMPKLKAPRLQYYKVSHNPIKESVHGENLGTLKQLDACNTEIKFKGGMKVRELFISDTSIVSKHVKYITDSEFIGQAEMRGVRDTMEDSIIVHKDMIPGVSVYAVFDGHGGSRTSIEATKILKDKIVAEESNFTFTCEHIKEVIQQLAEDIRALKYNDGSTMASAFVKDNKIISAHIGDARVLLIKDDGTIRFATKDHKPKERSEYERIHSIKGAIVRERVAGILAVARSLGDFNVHGVTYEPDMTELEVTESDKWLVICCDGVFDVLSNEFIGQLSLEQKSAHEFAYTLRNLAFAAGSMDNISAIVVDVKGM